MVLIRNENRTKYESHNNDDEEEPIVMESSASLSLIPHPAATVSTTTTTTRVEFASLLLLPPSAVTIPMGQQSSSSNNHNTPTAAAAATTVDNNTTHTSTDSGGVLGEISTQPFLDGGGGNSSDDQPPQSQQQNNEAVVVLQARIETCQELIAAATAAAASSTTIAGGVSMSSTQYPQTPDSSASNKNSSSVLSKFYHNTTCSLHGHQPQHPLPPSQQLLSPITQIQGVVDLDVLSTIAGVSRSDLVPDWQPPPSSSVAVTTTTDTVDGGGDDENDIVEINHTTTTQLQHETTPLLRASAVSSPATVSSSGLYHPDVIPYTLSPTAATHFNNHHDNKNNNGSNHHYSHEHVVTDTVLLKADAFVETLADILESQTNHTTNDLQQPLNNRSQHRDSDIEANGNNKDDDDDDDIESMTQDDDFDGDVTTNYDDVSGVTPGGAFFVPRSENQGANLRNYRQHAFLLEIPPLPLPPLHRSSNNSTYNSLTYSTGTSSDVPSHFILAFPKQDSTGLWQDDVSDASNDNNDNDSDSFLMGLTHLPTDVCDIQIEAIQYNDTETIRLDVVVKRQVPVVGYVILIGGLLALSSVGTALNLQHNVTPIMKSFWRYTSTWIVLFPIAIRSLLHDNHNSSSHSSSNHGIPQLSRIQWLCFIMCSFCYAFMTSAFVTALEYTTLANAFVLSNLAPLFIIVGRTVLGYAVLYMEGIGAMIGFIGGTICTLDQEPTRDGNGQIRDHPKALLGDSLAIMASATVAIYLLLAKKLRPHIDLFVFTFLLMLLSSVFVLLYMILTKEPMSFSNHIDHGLWGWTNWQWNRLPLEMYLAIVCNIVGTTGYIAVMKYFEPIVVSTVMLSEPVLGALMAAIVGSDALPGLQTWIGNIVVAVGIFLVIWSGARSTETIDATKALLQVNNNNNSDQDHNNNTDTTADTTTSHDPRNGCTSPGVPLLKNHPVAAVMNSPHRLRPRGRMRGESL